jgi:hypothetical protein
MGPDIKVNGSIIEPVEQASFIMPMVTFMKVSLKMIKPMVKEFITGMMDGVIMVTGKMTFSMEMGKNNFPINLFISENFI